MHDEQADKETELHSGGHFEVTVIANIASSPWQQEIRCFPISTSIIRLYIVSSNAQIILARPEDWSSKRLAFQSSLRSVAERVLTILCRSDSCALTQEVEPSDDPTGAVRTTTAQP
jgi:hypothetical protein